MGIPVGISPWWLVIVVLITWSLGASYFPEAVHGIAPAASYALGLASALLLFASILAHEFGHAIVARRRGIEIEEIDLWLLGGVSRMRGEAHDPHDELRYAIAGPMVSAVIAVCFAIAALTLPASTPSVVMALVEYQAFVNGLILVFNLLPAFPLDGGRVLRALLWRRSGEIARSTKIAASVGRGFGYLMIFLGALAALQGEVGGLWLAVIGFFVVIAAGAQAMGAQIKSTFDGVAARELMSAPALSLPASMTAAQAEREYFQRYRYSSFPVLGATGAVVGLVGAPQLRGLSHRHGLTLGDIANKDRGLIVGEDKDVVKLLESPAFQRCGRAVVIDRFGQPVGLVSITDVQRALREAEIAGHDDQGHLRAAA
ncbi:MAG TPA: site-2 protease family protein [Solirubrobacteraceae bacterium]|nr:site-2 protease family protein [Solirubrobacteraceae bacterium]